MVEIDFNPREIFDEIQKSTDVSLSEVAERVVLDTEPFVPKRTGELRQSVIIGKPSSSSIPITYSRMLFGRDVAEELNMGINPGTGNLIQHWTTPGTGGDWFEKSKSTNLDAWILYFRERTRELWRIRGAKKHSKK